MRIMGIKGRRTGMNGLTFWFWFIMIGSGCGFVAIGWLIVKAVKDRPKRTTIYVNVDKTQDAYVDIEYTGKIKIIEQGTADRIY